MRKLVTIGALVALLVAMFASAALAANFNCTTRICEGTSGNDVIYERGGDGVSDTIYGRRGADIIRANTFTNDYDVLIGGPGPDTLNADDGDPYDTLRGGKGNDTCRGDAGDTFLSCETIYIDGVLQP